MAEQTFADKEFCNQSGDVTNMPSMADKTNKLLICRKDENSFENFKLFFSQSDVFYLKRRLCVDDFEAFSNWNLKRFLFVNMKIICFFLLVL